MAVHTEGLPKTEIRRKDEVSGGPHSLRRVSQIIRGGVSGNKQCFHNSLFNKPLGMLLPNIWGLLVIEK